MFSLKVTLCVPYYMNIKCIRYQGNRVIQMWHCSDFHVLSTFIILETPKMSLFAFLCLLNDFFTLFYINRKKYWFRANFRLLVFDGFTRFGMSWKWIWLFLENVCLFVSDKNFVACVAWKPMNRIPWNFIFRVPPT